MIVSMVCTNLFNTKSFKILVKKCPNTLLNSSKIVLYYFHKGMYQDYISKIMTWVLLQTFREENKPSSISSFRKFETSPTSNSFCTHRRAVTLNSKSKYLSHQHWKIRKEILIHSLCFKYYPKIETISIC